MVATVAPAKLYTTAELIRGRVYFYGSHKFERGVRQVIESAKLAEELEALLEPVTDTEGEIIDKPMFAIRRNQPHPNSPQGQQELIHRATASRVLPKPPIRIRKPVPLD